MLPLIPIAAAVTSAAVLVRRNLKKAVLQKRLHDLSQIIQCNNIPVDDDGSFDPDTLTNGTPLLFKTIRQIDLLKSLLEYGANPDIYDSKGTPAIVYATQLICADAILMLLNYGANPNAMDSEGKTAIFYASTDSIIKILVDKGADINAVDSTGKTALFYSFSNNTTEYLISHGADINAKDSNGDTVLFYIPDANKFATLHYLEKRGLNIHALDHNGNPFKYLDEYSEYLSKHYRSNKSLNKKLFDAVNNNNIDDAVNYLRLGASPDTRDETVPNWNMIHLAVHRNNPKMIRALAQCGVNINFHYNGVSPLEKAIFHHSEECVKTLLELGADPAFAASAVKHNGTNNIKKIFEQYYHGDITK